MNHLEETLSYIEDNLEKPLSLTSLAKVAKLSPFHFTRSFSSLSGMSAMEYVRRRRLTVAAHKLKSTDARIIDIALCYGFESQEAFSRTFKQFVGITPGLYRKNGGGNVHLQNPITVNELNYIEGLVDLIPKIMTLDEINIVGLDITFTMETRDKIGGLWKQFGPRQNEIDNRQGPETFGVCVPRKGALSESFLYIAGVRVSTGENLPDGMKLINIPKQDYAIFTFSSNDEPFPASLHRFVHQIWSVWLPKSDYETTGQADFELYDGRFNPVVGKGEFDIYIPVQKTAF